MEETNRQGAEFRTRLSIELRNVSDRGARIAMFDNANGEHHLPPGEAILAPNDARVYTWTRYLGLGLLETHTDIDDPKNCQFDLALQVSDLAQNVRDTYIFNGDLRLSCWDGARLAVRPEPEHRWVENVAVPQRKRIRKRIYERLVAEERASKAVTDGPVPARVGRLEPLGFFC